MKPAGIALIALYDFSHKGPFSKYLKSHQMNILGTPQHPVCVLGQLDEAEEVDKAGQLDVEGLLNQLVVEVGLLNVVRLVVEAGQLDEVR